MPRGRIHCRHSTKCFDFELKNELWYSNCHLVWNMSFPKVKIPPCDKWEGSWSLWVNKSEGFGGWGWVVHGWSVVKCMLVEATVWVIAL